MSILFYSIICQFYFIQLCVSPILFYRMSILFYCLPNLFLKKAGGGAEVSVSQIISQRGGDCTTRTESKIVLQTCLAITPQLGSRCWIWDYQLRGRIGLERLPLELLSLLPPEQRGSCPFQVQHGSQVLISLTSDSKSEAGAVSW